MSGSRVSRVYLKLGTSCNLHCPHCHAATKPIVFNPSILPVLKSLNLKRLTFGGGEPLVYWDLIKQIVTFLGNDLEYKIVTNGTLFTDEMVTFCNRYKFLVFISDDGVDSARDVSVNIPWNIIMKLNHCGTAVTFYKENSDIRRTLESLAFYKENFMTIPSWIYSSYPNFVHSTALTGVLSDKELAKSYVDQISALADEAFALYVKKGILTGFLRRIFQDFIKVKSDEGVRCCNPFFLSVLADGTICSCPYTMEPVGDLFHLESLDFDAVKHRYMRPGCAGCDLYSICRNYCCADVTDNFCYVMKHLHETCLHLMDKYNLSYDSLSKFMK